MKIIPIRIDEERIIPDEVIEKTFSELNLREKHIEDFIRRHIDQIFIDEEESLLIIGQQTRDKKGGKSDLIAINSDGDLVLIEIKRDFSDIVHRSEAFEFQAIRYAASLAMIQDEEEIVQNLYAKYINKHKAEYAEIQKGFTAEEVARRRLGEFVDQHQIGDNVNENQKVVLTASGFDDYTLSASAWLAKNGIDIRCIVLEPFEYKDQVHIKVHQLVPPQDIEDYFIEVDDTIKAKATSQKNTKRAARRRLPRMPKLLEWGIIEEGMELEIVNHPDDKATIVNAYMVKYQDETMKFNDWGQKVTGWSSICIYEWARPVRSSKTLADLRREKMEELEKQS